MKKRNALLMSILVIFLACSSSHKEKGIAPKKEVMVKRGSIVLEVTATGAVKPQVGAQVKVGSRISGKVEKLFVQAGDTVKKGMLIAVIEHDDLKAVVDARRNQMIAAKNELEKVKKVYPEKIKAQEAYIKKLEAEVHLAELEYNRIKRLFDEALVAQDDLDRATRDLKVKKAELENALRSLAALKNEYKKELKKAVANYKSALSLYKEAKVRLNYAFIYSPISGVVSSVSTQQGETVVAGLNAPTFITVIDLNRLQVDAYVDETDIGKVKPGQDVRFVVDAYPDKVFKGVVRTIYPGAIIRNNVVFYDVAIDIKTPYTRYLKPEMTADVTIIAGRKDNVLLVPAGAVKIDSEGNSYCFVKREGKWKKVKVKTGWESSGKVEIIEGLREKEVVAVW